MLESPFVTNRPSGAIVAFLIKNQISLFMSPAFDVGTLPEVRWLLAALYESLFCWACNQAALLKNMFSVFNGAHFAVGLMTVSDI